MSVTPSDHSTENLTGLNESGEPDQSFRTPEAPRGIEDAETARVPIEDTIKSSEAAVEDAVTSKVPAIDGKETAGAAITEIETDKVPATSPPMYREGAAGPITQPIKRQDHGPRSKRRRIIMLSLLAILLLGILIPVGVLVGYGINAYTTYSDLKNQANDGVQHLLNVKTVFTGLKAHPTGFLDAGKLRSAQHEFAAARQDFEQLSYKIDNTPVIQTIITYLPQ